MARYEGPYGPEHRVVGEAVSDTGAVDQWGDPDLAEVITGPMPDT
jgi:hypothetical protein